jgi:hypothetical protein
MRAMVEWRVPGLTRPGACGPSGSWLDPAKPPARPQYAARRWQGQQAGVVMNVPGFCTGQVSGRFVAPDTAFALIERLPAVVTAITPDRSGVPGSGAIVISNS